MPQTDSPTISSMPAGPTSSPDTPNAAADPTAVSGSASVSDASAAAIDASCTNAAAMQGVGNDSSAAADAQEEGAAPSTSHAESGEPFKQSPFVKNYKATKHEAKAAHSAYTKAVHNKQSAVKKAERRLQEATEQKTKYRAKLGDVTLFIDRVLYKGSEYPLTPDIEVRVDTTQSGGSVSEVSSGGRTTITAPQSQASQENGDASNTSTKPDEQHLSMTVKTQSGTFCALFKASKEAAVRKLAADIVVGGVNAQKSIAAADEAIKKAQDNLNAVNAADYGITDAKTLDDQKTATFSSLKEGMSEENKYELASANREIVKEVGIGVVVFVVIVLIIWALMTFVF